MAERSKKELIYDFTRSRTEALSEDTSHSRATLARLRRGVGKKVEEFPDAWGTVLGDLDEALLSKDGVVSEAEVAIFTALTLYALHQQGKYPKKMSRDENSFGAAIKKLVVPDVNEQAIKRRFDAIITARDYTELSHHARGLVQLLKTKDVPLDYARFASDLYELQFPEKKNKVRLRWGEDYYRINKSVSDKKEESAK